MPAKAHDDDLVMSLVEMALASPRPDQTATYEKLCAEATPS